MTTRRGAIWLAPISIALGCLLVLAGCTTHHGNADPNPPNPLSPSRAGSASTAPAPNGSAISRGTRTAAELHIDSGFTTVQIVTADIGSDLLQVSGPAGAADTPTTTLNGDLVTITQAQGGNPVAVLIVRLSTAVTWQLNLDGGATSATLDLHTGKVGGIDLNQGVTALTIRLPAPGGTTALNLVAGASHVIIRVAGSAPARVTMAGGAGSVSLYGQAHTGISAGTVFQSPTWAVAHDRLDVMCTAGVSALVVQAG